MQQYIELQNGKKWLQENENIVLVGNIFLGWDENTFLERTENTFSKGMKIHCLRRMKIHFLTEMNMKE